MAAGAASIRFSLLVTVTVRYDGDLAQAVSTSEAGGRAAPVRLRRVYGPSRPRSPPPCPSGSSLGATPVVSPSVREWL